MEIAVQTIVICIRGVCIFQIVQMTFRSAQVSFCLHFWQGCKSNTNFRGHTMKCSHEQFLRGIANWCNVWDFCISGTSFAALCGAELLMTSHTHGPSVSLNTDRSNCVISSQLFWSVLLSLCGLECSFSQVSMCVSKTTRDLTFFNLAVLDTTAAYVWGP